MSAYNVSSYIYEAMESILSQTFKDFEFIIIDDSSTDNTWEIINQFSDRRIRKLRNPKNLGYSISLNKAINISQGKYIARQDADDISLPERLEKQVSYLEKHPEVVLLGTSAEIMDEEGVVFYTPPVITGKSKVKEILFAGENPFFHGSVMMRKSCLKEVGGYRTILEPAEDFDLWLRMAEKYEVDILPERLYRYRITPHAVSIKKRNKQIQSYLWAKRFFEERKEKGKDYLQQYGRLPPPSPVPPETYARRLYFWGSKMFCAGYYRGARRWLGASLRQNPFLGGEVWLMWLYTLLPLSIRKIYRKVKKYFQGDK